MISSLYLGASSNGDDTGEEIPDDRFQRGRQAIYVDGVDQTQTVLFVREGEIKKISLTALLPSIIMILLL